ncbi:hypothetical protein BASA81_014082 [Batrachochytrium salamandrivorans]|nr:hypothetical protein BASA81_014082 [Batrachochytrium salamandrivorans]
MAAESTPAIQVDGVAPTVTHIADNGACNPRSTAVETKHGARFRITVPEDRQRNIIQRLERQSKQPTGVFRKKRPTSPSSTSLDQQPTSTTITADPRSQCCQHQQQTACYSHIVRNTRLWAISETCITSSKFRLLYRDSMSYQHPATGPGRKGIALGIPSCFGGHETCSAVGTMILAKVLNFTPECLWIVGSVYVGHSGAPPTTVAERHLLVFGKLSTSCSIRQQPSCSHFGDWNTDPQRLQRIVHLWGHGLTVMQFSGSQITRLSTVHGRTSFVN